MEIAVMKIFTLCILFSITSCVSSQSNNSSVDDIFEDEISASSPESQNDNASMSNDQKETPQAEEEISDIAFCKLLRSPEKFDQQLIRVKAIFRRGFEKSEFYSLKCTSDEHVWVKGGTDKKCQNSGSVDGTKYDGGELTAGVVVVGRFTGIKGRYGHLGAGDYEFKIDCVERYEVLDSNSAAAQYLTLKQRRKIEKFER